MTKYIFINKGEVLSEFHFLRVKVAFKVKEIISAKRLILNIITELRVSIKIQQNCHCS
jgi:hypothetical protein